LDGAVSPDGRRAVLLVAAPAGEAPNITTHWQVVELDLADGSVHETGIRGVFPAPTGALGVDFASDAGSLLVWDRTSDAVSLVDLTDGTTTPVHVAPDPDKTVRWRALPDGAARLGADGEIVLVGRDGEPAQVLQQHQGPVLDVDVAPDGTWAASAGDGLPGELYRWDVDPATGRWGSPELLPGHDGAVIDVGIADGGERLVTTSADTTAISWRMGADADSDGAVRTMDPAGLVAVACAIVGRDFTQVEWDRYLPDRPFEPTCSDVRPPDA
jgi:WD40 repeat protein